MDRYPELRQQMNDRFGAIGRLRVRQAIENGDYRQVEAATIQFFGSLLRACCGNLVGELRHLLWRELLASEADSLSQLSG